MVSIKALAAIALTMMVVVPIGLGYMLATEDVEYDEWSSTGTSNLSEQILNHATPYFTSYNGSTNNSQLLQRQYFTLQAITEWHHVQPDYLSVSSTYSAVPIYTTSSVSVTMDSLVGDSSGTCVVTSGQSYGSSVSDTYTMLDTGKSLYYFAFTSSYTGIHRALVVDGNTVQYGMNNVYAMKSGDGWTIYSVNEMNAIYTATEVTAWKFIGDANFTVLPFYQDAATVTSLTSYSMATDHPTAVTITFNNSTVAYDAVLGYASVTWDSSGLATVDGRSYTNVATLGFATGIASENLYYDAMTVVADTYANVSAGWKLPQVSGAATSDWWTNNQLNASVRMMISFSDAAHAYIGPVADIGDTYPVELNYSAGVMYVIDQATNISYSLGNYSKVMVVMDQESATVYGISSWPSLGKMPATLNSVTIDYTDLEPFTYIALSAVDPEDVSFRVDAANVVAGYFPSTKDYTLNMDALYPNSSYSIKFNSIGVYGDSINIGSTSFAVTDGRISVGGVTVALKGATITSLYNGSSFDNAINGLAVNTTGSPASIVFGGEWSLTITSNTLEETTNTKTEWTPGEFAFDKRDFAAVGLMVAGACLVGLGMMGQRSGVKMGILLLICGGAAFAYLTML